MRSNDIQVDDVPRHLSPSSLHAIVCKDENLKIPLILNGVISYFHARTPSLYEIENCQHITLTSDEEWNPYSTEFEEQEDQVQTNRSINALRVECIEHY
jgi:hypothetical protein